MFDLNQYISKTDLDEICRKYKILKLSLFGSGLRDELNPESDIDLLIEFEQGETPGLITFCGIENELTSLIGRKVDLRTPKDLSRYFRDDVMNQAEVIHVNS